MKDIILRKMNKKLLPTPCKNNCLVLAYLEIPAEFPQARKSLLI